MRSQVLDVMLLVLCGRCSCSGGGVGVGEGAGEVEDGGFEGVSHLELKKKKRERGLGRARCFWQQHTRTIKHDKIKKEMQQT